MFVAYGDESRKPLRSRKTGAPLIDQQKYAMAAIVIAAEDRRHLRESVVAVADAYNGGLPFHWSELSRSRRHAVAGAISHLDWDARLAATRGVISERDDRRARHHVLGMLAVDLARLDVRTLTLETRDMPNSTSMAARDLATIDALREEDLHVRDLRIEHDSKVEPLLWLADAVVGAWTDSLTGSDELPHAIVAHKARVVGLYP